MENNNDYLEQAAGDTKENNTENVERENSEETVKDLVLEDIPENQDKNISVQTSNTTLLELLELNDVELETFKKFLNNDNRKESLIINLDSPDYNSDEYKMLQTRYIENLINDKVELDIHKIVNTFLDEHRETLNLYVVNKLNNPNSSKRIRNKKSYRQFFLTYILSNLSEQVKAKLYHKLNQEGITIKKFVQILEHISFAREDMYLILKKKLMKHIEDYDEIENALRALAEAAGASEILLEGDETSSEYDSGAKTITVNGATTIKSVYCSGLRMRSGEDFTVSSNVITLTDDLAGNFVVEAV